MSFSEIGKGRLVGVEEVDSKVMLLPPFRELTYFRNSFVMGVGVISRSSPLASQINLLAEAAFVSRKSSESM
ncbi:hypothetical protein BCCGELA001_30560 [Bradyrhizobium sp. CCGE-LA001]|nr:hypothetical protein BCCGELA001_30560 [Bradyrhizobium sp. CCGE-LA001]